MLKKLVLVGTFLATGATAQASPPLASEHGCQVLLCMANPGGPMKVPECRPPMKKLYKDLSKGKPFPACDFTKSEGETGKPAKKSYAENKFATKNYCHPDYYVPQEDTYPPYCKMSGAVTVTVEGVPTQRVWWKEDGETVTENWGGSLADNFADPVIETPPEPVPGTPATPGPATPLTKDQILARIAYLTPLWEAGKPFSVASYKALEDCVNKYGPVQEGFCQAELAFHAATADPIKAYRDEIYELKWLLLDLGG